MRDASVRKRNTKEYRFTNGEVVMRRMLAKHLERGPGACGSHCIDSNLSRTRTGYVYVDNSK
jgi:hypothetical protein